jgi:hypothetical protein
MNLSTRPLGGPDVGVKTTLLNLIRFGVVFRYRDFAISKDANDTACLLLQQHGKETQYPNNTAGLAAALEDAQRPF